MVVRVVVDMDVAGDVTIIVCGDPNHLELRWMTSLVMMWWSGSSLAPSGHHTESTVVVVPLTSNVIGHRHGGHGHRQDMDVVRDVVVIVVVVVSLTSSWRSWRAQCSEPAVWPHACKGVLQEQGVYRGSWWHIVIFRCGFHAFCCSCCGEW